MFLFFFFCLGMFLFFLFCLEMFLLFLLICLEMLFSLFWKVFLSRSFLRPAQARPSKLSRSPIQLVDEKGCVVRPKIMSPFKKIKNFDATANVLSYAYFQARTEQQQQQPN